jgi:ABC-type transporter Mla subunit MlaD
MALQDLTPQLRTRLSRMERAVGWFVFVATALLLFGFGYYIYHTAERKGWFKIRAPFFTFVQSSEGLKVGDDVVMMGFAVGHITRIHAQPPGDPHNVLVEFEIRDDSDSFRYIRTGGSFVKVNSADFLGKRQLEVTRGTNGLGSYAICVTQPISVYGLEEAKKLAMETPGHWQLAQDVLDEKTNVIFHAYDFVETVLDASNAPVLANCMFESNSIYIYDNAINRDRIVASWHRRDHRYENFTPNSEDAYLHAVETPPISDQLQAMVSQVQSALPGILLLTNKISAVLDNAADATSNLNTTFVAAQPMVTNFAVISGQLREPGGALNWALGMNGSGQLQDALTNVNALLVNTDTNLNGLAASLGQTLDHLADITSNLNAQVQADTNLLGGISKTIGDTDDFVQGLKRHWLLRSAFKTKATNAPAKK